MRVCTVQTSAWWWVIFQTVINDFVLFAFVAERQSGRLFNVAAFLPPSHLCDTSWRTENSLNILIESTTREPQVRAWNAQSFRSDSQTEIPTSSRRRRLWSHLVYPGLCAAASSLSCASEGINSLGCSVPPGLHSEEALSQSVGRSVHWHVPQLLNVVPLHSIIISHHTSWCSTHCCSHFDLIRL